MVRLVVWVPVVWGILRSPLESQVETTLGLFGTQHFLKEKNMASTHEVQRNSPLEPTVARVATCRV